MPEVEYDDDDACGKGLTNPLFRCPKCGSPNFYVEVESRSCHHEPTAYVVCIVCGKKEDVDDLPH